MSEFKKTVENPIVRFERPDPVIDESLIVDYKRKNKNTVNDFRKDKIVYFNPKYDELFAPTFGPVFDDEEDKSAKNFLTGYIEDTHINEVQFEEQRKAFHFKGKASNPSDNLPNALIEKNLASSLIGSTVSDNETKKDKKERNYQ
jgi:hypothetical protein